MSIPILGPDNRMASLKTAPDGSLRVTATTGPQGSEVAQALRVDAEGRLIIGGEPGGSTTPAAGSVTAEMLAPSLAGQIAGAASDAADAQTAAQAATSPSSLAAGFAQATSSAQFGPLVRPIFRWANIFIPDAKGDGVGASDLASNGTTVTSAYHYFGDSDVGRTLYLNGSAYTVTGVNGSGGCTTSPAIGSTSGQFWFMVSDDTAAINDAITAAAEHIYKQTEDGLYHDGAFLGAGIVHLPAGRIYGLFNSSASYNGGAGKWAALKLKRRSTIRSDGVGGSRAALMCLPGFYGHVLANESPASYSDFISVESLQIYGNGDFSANQLDGVHIEMNNGSGPKVDAFNRVFNVRTERVKRDGFRFTGRGELEVAHCTSVYSRRYGFHFDTQYDWRMTSCNAGGNQKTGVRVNASSTGKILGGKSFYNGGSGGSVLEDCANLVLGGDSSRNGFVSVCDMELQESRGPSIVINNGNHHLIGVKCYDPYRSGLITGTLPAKKAAIVVQGAQARNVIFTDVVVSPQVAIWSNPNWTVDVCALHVDGYDTANGGPQGLTGNIVTYQPSLEPGGATLPGIQYTGVGAALTGAGVSNGKNTNLSVDGLALA